LIGGETSALLKLYIQENHSDALKESLAKAEAVAVCRIAWAEAHAALARRAREIPAERGYDSVQLVAAFEAGRIAETVIDFACFDSRLNKAAQTLGMRAIFLNKEHL
jgi:uncharacterized protein with PIN domain